jgi:hypothetical protein
MIIEAERIFVAQHAYVPEHMVDYVVAMTGAEPFLLRNYLCYRSQRRLTLVGYPLADPQDTTEVLSVLRDAVERFEPDHVALIAPRIPPLPEVEGRESDHYYRLDLAGLRLSQNVRCMIRRAGKEVRVESGREMSPPHEEIIEQYLEGSELGEGTRVIFQKVPHYIRSVPSTVVYSAWDGTGKVVAFSVGELGASECAFYMFNFNSRDRYVPGASDLLLHRLLQDSEDAGKVFVNLGLGINKGIAFFKTKWGGYPFLPYEQGEYRPGTGVKSRGAFRKLMGHVHHFLAETQKRRN